MRGVPLGVPVVGPLLLLAFVLAGCSEGPPSSAEIVVESKPPEEVRSDEATAAVFTPAAKTRGHIAGVVVDEAIRPIEGARVRLPGMDLERPTDRDGSFGFVDLHPGPYFVTVEAEGYRAAEAVLEVREEEFTRAKVILTAIPPPDPYKVTQSFEGFAEVTDTGLFVTGLACDRCDFDLYIDRPGLQTVVLEAVMDGATEGSSFEYDLGTYECCDSYAYGSSSNPLVAIVKAEDLGNGTDDRFRVGMYPMSFPAPEASKRFEVFVTAFYNEAAPTGWSFVAGDP